MAEEEGVDEVVAVPRPGVPANIGTDLIALSDLVDGCQDNPNGRKSKNSIVKAYLKNNGRDALDTMCALHLLGSVSLSKPKLLGSITWKRPSMSKQAQLSDAGNPGLFLAGTLASCAAEGEMAEHVDKYFQTNQHVNVIEVIRYVNAAGYISVDATSIMSSSVTNWNKPPPDGRAVANWKKMWEGELPSGPPTYVDLIVRPRGRKARMAFLGSPDDSGANPTLKAPPEIFQGQWNLTPPSNICNADAGSMHPRQCDSINRMANLPQVRVLFDPSRARARQPFCHSYPVAPSDPLHAPAPSLLLSWSQFYEWVAEASAGPGGGPGLGESGKRDSLGPIERPRSEGGDTSTWGVAREAQKQGKFINLAEVVRRSIQHWQEELPMYDNDGSGDSSINNLIYTKVKEVFSSLIDAATLSGAWLLIDRTDGQGSATAEVLLEAALERQRGAGSGNGPTIVAVDSLERLGNARKGSRAHEMLKQLNAMVMDEENASQNPTGSEKELEIDFLYTLDEFDVAQTYAGVPDENLPFDVVPEHKRANMGGTCDPNRKWRYFYVDGMFSAATHYVIKSNDQDEFNMEMMGQNVFVYAHGDTRTYKRLRANIQQGRPIVMLHNSGGVVTAFSWLQRVMAYSRPPPDATKMRGPLRFIIASLSKANWVIDFGVPEMMMMKTLAERAPQLFRKNVVSVDILTDSEEATLEVITGCFAAVGGVPELGLGNAEVNVIFNAWNMYLLLTENAKAYWRASVIAQTMVWILSIITTALAIGISSMKGGILAPYFVGVDAELVVNVSEALDFASLVLPILSAILTTTMAKLLWRDKWSVCKMCASLLVGEIYKFRVNTLEYDPPPKPASLGEEETKALTPKEKARVARQTFVKRVGELYGACLTELSQGGALKKKRAKVATNERHDYRTSKESKPTLAEWFKIKRHVERFFFKTKWEMPSGDFLNWISGLRPYLNQRTLREELRSVLDQMASDKKIVLIGKPLSDGTSDQVRFNLAKRLGLKPRMLDRQKQEIRKVQRELVVAMFKEQQEDLAAMEEEKEEKRRMSVIMSGRDPDDEDEDGIIGQAAAVGGAVARAITGSAPTQPLNEDEEHFTDASEAMRTHIMEMQGLKYGKLTAKEKEEQKKQKKKVRVMAKAVEDDYLFGALSVDSYVVFRTRPLAERIEKTVGKLSIRLQVCDIVSFIVNATGSILAALQWTEWISFTVATVAVLTGIVEFTQLRNQVVSCNLALRDLQAIELMWDSLSLVNRRTPAVKAQVVGTTEGVFRDVVDAHTTAASNTQTSVAKSLNGEANDVVEE
jgi:hypothetical protein